MFSGGTEVTIYGRNFDSVAEPRITLTVVVTRFDSNMSVTSVETYTSTEVMTALCTTLSVRIIRGLGAVKLSMSLTLTMSMSLTLTAQCQCADIVMM